MPSEARHHHYLPQCYLKGFTRDGQRTSQLWAWDFKLKRKYPTVPRNVGGQRDFNRIDVPDVPPNAVEVAMSKIENEFDAALTAVNTNLDWDNDIKNWIFNLMALMVVRNPQQRENRRDFQAQVSERMLDLLLESRESWERSTLPESGEGSSARKLTYEEAKDFRESKQYTIEVPALRHIHDEGELVGAILPCLARRKWTVLVATPESGNFITTDNPVTLDWNDPSKVPPIYRSSPGFGMNDTTVHFAVSKKVAIFGTFDGEDRALIAAPEITSLFNTHLLARTYGRAFSPDPYMRVRNSMDMVADLSDAEFFTPPNGDAK
jgi:hypothetical protein